MNNDLISREALKNDFDCVWFNDYDDYNRALRIIDNAPTVEQPNCKADMRGNTKRKGTPIEGNNESYNCENWIP